MWRLLTSVHRAFRHHVQKPRPSAAVVEDDSFESDSSESEEQSSHHCPYIAVREKLQSFSSADVDNDSIPENKRSIFGFVNYVKTQLLSVRDNVGSVQEETRRWWPNRHYDFWSLVQGSSHRVPDAVSLEWPSLFGSAHQPNRELYQLLFAFPGWQRLSLTSASVSAAANVATSCPDSGATGGDNKVQESTVEQEFDSVFAEFQSLCQDYSAISESLQGLDAWERGDIKSGVQHLREAAQLGNTSACFNMGLCYEIGTGVKEDLDKAKHYYHKAADEGHATAMYNLALIYCRQQNDGQANSASESQTSLAKGDFEKGLDLMTKAAKQGMAEAQTYLGFHHLTVTQDLPLAVSFLSTAAQEKNMEAQYLLGLCHDQGWGVELNECKAAQLFSRAATAGHDLAMCCLAQYTEKGMGGLPVDVKTAKDLYAQSADSGCLEAKERLEEISQQEKLDALEKKVDDFNKNLRSFHELYQLHHTQDHRRRNSSSSDPLSPSSSSPSLSSPSLTDYSQTDKMTKKNGYKCEISFDPGGKGFGKIKFSLGESLDSLEETDFTELDSSLDSYHSGSGDEAPFNVQAFQKSKTLPNLTI